MYRHRDKEKFLKLWKGFYLIIRGNMLNYVIQVNFEKPKFLKVGKVRKMLKSLSKKKEKSMHHAFKALIFNQEFRSS